jgi:hypothetical protein
VYRVLTDKVLAPGGGRGRNKAGVDGKNEVERLLRQYEGLDIKPGSNGLGFNIIKNSEVPRVSKPSAADDPFAD